ncbi:MAG: zinc ABC transporter substrate-binding protein [Gammaproteobacteria bacterium]|nr:zinc ABC transporter substrate-binding protein [Gammaproteobacteria bacterium]
MFYSSINRPALVLALVLALLLPFFAHQANAQLNVFACEPEWAALTQALTQTIGSDQVKVTSATTAMQDPHHIQARPSLIAKMRRADLLVCTGADLEVGWLPLLLRKSGNASVQPGQAGHFMAADTVTLLEKPALLDRSLGDIHAAGNPHFHLDPERILKVAVALANTLATVDPGNQSHYENNLATFTQQWQQAIEQWRQRSESLRGKRIVVSHNSWVYLEPWLGLTQVATLEPKPGIPASSAHLSKLLAQLEQNPADMLLYASYQSDKSARWLTKKTTIPAVALPFSPSKDETLIQWFDRLLTQLLSVKQ